MNDKCSKGKKKERGTALLFAIFLTLLLAIIGSSMILTWQASKRSANSLQTAVQDHYLLEAGVADVLSYLDSQVQGDTSTINCSDAKSWLTQQFEPAISDMKTRGKKYQIDLVSRPQDYSASQLAYQIQVTAQDGTMTGRDNPFVTINLLFKNQTTGSDPFYMLTGSYAFAAGAMNPPNINYATQHPDQADSITKTLHNVVNSFLNSQYNDMVNYKKNHPNVQTYTQGSNLSGDWMTNGDLVIDKKQSLTITRGSLYVKGNLVVNGTLSVDGNLYVSGQISSNGPIIVKGSLYSAGSVSITDTLTVNGDMVVYGSYSGGVSKIKGSLVVRGAVSLFLQGNSDLCEVDGDVLVDGSVSLSRQNNGQGHVQYQIGGHLVSAGSISIASTFGIANGSVPINGFGGRGSSSLSIQSISY
jgi:cytoskeletal protein CcmA (bactofilin family)/Tfp pilus assembly protein PilX